MKNNNPLLDIGLLKELLEVVKRHVGKDRDYITFATTMASLATCLDMTSELFGFNPAEVRAILLCVGSEVDQEVRSNDVDSDH